MKCVNHPDRMALGYCSRCGKALCNECLVRLSTGNYCDACANERPLRKARRAFPWWLAVLAAAGLLVLVRLFAH